MRFLSTYTPARRATAPLWSEFDHFFGDISKRWSQMNSDVANSFGVDDRDFAPACDIAETDTSFVLSLDVPGMKKDEIKVEAEGDVLTISGERKHELSTETKDKFQRIEKSYGFFKRSFSLPNTVDAEKIAATYENGVLHLTLPKTSPAQARSITIK